MEAGELRRHVAIVNELTKFAEGKDATVSQLALAWLLAKNDSIVPIPGSRNTGRVTENVAAVELTLTADDLSRIGEIAPEGGVGGRFD